MALDQSQVKHASSFKEQFTARAIIIGVVGSIILTCSSMFVALKASSLPWPIMFVALASMFALKAMGNTNVNEINVAHTCMSAGAMVAGGLAFTIPGIFILNNDAEFSILKVMLVTVGGTVLGLIFTSLIRKHFVVEADMPYAMGQAAAEVVVVGDEGGKQTGALFGSLGIAGLWTALRDWFADRSAVLLAGPGLGESAPEVCRALLGKNAPWRGAVLDADALNALAAGKLRGGLPANTILTPHPGEAARLLGTTVAEIQADRAQAARQLAKKYDCIAILKGSGTLVAKPDGTLWHNNTGNAGLARGGSGDVLAGLTAGLLAAGPGQGRSPEDAAVAAVWLHGAAADRCAKHRSMTAMLPTDIFADLEEILAEMAM